MLRTLLSHLVLPSSGPRLHWHREYGKDIFRFGKWIFLSSGMALLSTQADRLILGKLFPMKMLGVYIIACTLSDVLRQVVGRTSSNVIFPALAQQFHLSREKMRWRMIRPRKHILTALTFALNIPVAFGDLIISFLYDDRYIQAGWMLSVLSLGLWPALLALTLSPALLAAGKPQYEAFGHGLRFFLILTAIPAGFHLLGIPGAIIATAGGHMMFYAAVALGIWKEGGACPVQDITSTLLFLCILSSLLLFRIAFDLGFPLTVLFQG
jgi:O-antigen/teichoic acid export membrane protein